jgi:hypothetical protein
MKFWIGFSVCRADIGWPLRMVRMRRELADFRGGDFLGRLVEHDALDIVADLPAALIG